MNLIKLFFTLFFIILLSRCSSNYFNNFNYDNNYEFESDRCGYEVGDIACDFTLQDQNGNTLSLYKHYRQVILLDFSAGWCYVCKIAAKDVTSTRNKYKRYGFSYLTILADGDGWSPLNQKYLKHWAEGFKIKEPVLLGSYALLKTKGHDGWRVRGWPTFVVIGRDMKVKGYIVGYNKETIEQSVSKALGLYL
jgi:peroxiredoxin